MTEIVYILGSTRSGTSALRNAINETAYSGYGEGHMAPLLTELLDRVRAHKREGLGARVPGNALSGLDAGALLKELFAGYERYLSARVGSDRLIDKTPTVVPIRAAPDLAAFHGRARFVHCARRHLDNVLSKRRKFPGIPFEQHCREWVTCNAAWLGVREVMEGNFVEFDFHELATDPGAIAARIGAYLEVSEEETESMRDYLASRRPEAEAGRDPARFARLGETDWSDEEKGTFMEICTPLGTRMGYGLESYFAHQEEERIP